MDSFYKKYILLTVFLILSFGIGTFVYAQTTVNKDFNFTNSNYIYSLQGISIGTSTTNNNAITFSDGTVFNQNNAGAAWTTNSNGIHYNSGSVGIGVTSPNSKLDVNGAIYGSIFYDKNNSSYYINPSGNSQTRGEIDILVNDSENIITSRNDSASGDPDQFFLRHDFGRVEVGNSRGEIEMLSTLDLSSNKIINLGGPTSASDAATKSYVDSTVSGGTSANAESCNADGTCETNNIKISSNGNIISGYNNDYIVKDHGNGNVTLSAAGGDLYLGYQNTNQLRFNSPSDTNLNMNSNKITALATPTSNSDAATKSYVDSTVIADTTCDGATCNVTNTGTLDGLNPPNFFNNMGNSHGTTQDFNLVPDFGARYVQGNTNGPGTGSSQFYGFTLGLGSGYSLSQYALQLAIPRYIGTDDYLSIRTRESGTWQAWTKISAGYADNAGQLEGQNGSYYLDDTTVDGCTNCLNTQEIEDIYVLNSSDSMSGKLTVKQIDGGATELEINAGELNLSGYGSEIVHIGGESGVRVYSDANNDGGVDHTNVLIDSSGNADFNGNINMSNNTISQINQLNFNSGERIYDGTNLRLDSNSGYLDLRPSDGTHGIILRDIDGSSTAWSGIRTQDNGTMELRADGASYSQLQLFDSGTVTIGGGSGKLNVGTVDPLYTINGNKYATYMPGMIGIKEEITGVVSLDKFTKENNLNSYTIDFTNLKEGSDLWLFAEAINMGNRAHITKDGKVYKTTAEELFNNFSVLLTSGFNGDVWYEKDPKDKTITIYTDLNNSDVNGEVSYRFTAPRFDWKKWSNEADTESEGLNLDERLQ